MMNLVQKFRQGHCKGMTIVELLLALAGTAFVSVAIVMMLSAVATGTNSRTDLRQSVVRQKTVTARLNAAIRSSHMVLLAEDDLLVLWTNDTDSNGAPNLAEIQRIERHSASGELRAFKAPSTLSEDDNTEYDLLADFDSVTSAIKGTSDFPQEVWATGLHNWTVAINADAPQDASLVSIRISIGEGEMRETLICAAALRNNGMTSFSASSGDLITSAESSDDGDESQNGSSDDSSDEDVSLNEGVGDSGSGSGSDSSSGGDDDDEADNDGGNGKGKSKGKGKGKGNDGNDDDDEDKGKGKGKGDDDDDDDDDKGKGKGKGDDDDDDDDKGKGKGKGNG